MTLDEPKVKKLILTGGTEVDLSKYKNLWIQESGTPEGRGGGAWNLTPTAIRYAMKVGIGSSSYIVLSKNRDMYGRVDPKGMRIPASLIVDFAVEI